MTQDHERVQARSLEGGQVTLPKSPEATHLHSVSRLSDRGPQKGIASKIAELFSFARATRRRSAWLMSPPCDAVLRMRSRMRAMRLAPSAMCRSIAIRRLSQLLVTGTAHPTTTKCAGSARDGKGYASSLASARG